MTAGTANQQIHGDLSFERTTLEFLDDGECFVVKEFPGNIVHKAVPMSIDESYQRAKREFFKQIRKQLNL